MTRAVSADAKVPRSAANGGRSGSAPKGPAGERLMTAFVESCVETAAGSAEAVERRSRRHPKARRLIKLLADKRRILITTHQHPDPDGLGSALALRALFAARLPDAEISISVSGRVGGGLNQAFLTYAKLNLVPWDESRLSEYDAIILLDCQPGQDNSPLPPEVKPLAIIDHHGRVGRRAQFSFCDIRKDVGATGSIIFSYFMETDTPITPQLAATLLYAIETDLAGAAGMPADLDNVALSSLTLLADTHRLYQMRYVDLPRAYFIACGRGLNTAQCYEKAIVSHLQSIESLEMPAVLADFLLRYENAHWVLVTAIHGQRLILSLRTSEPRGSAATAMKKLIRGIGQGGGHRTKAGGFVPLASTDKSEVDQTRAILLRRYLRALGIRMTKGEPLVPRD
jgi:nanoRNase/pAp phosphatase (c-di-AMP/oligoRNAs hydrolase)